MDVSGNRNWRKADIFYGANVEAMRVSQPVTTDRIAPTLARIMRVRAPNACSAEPLF